jgi:hypothetical protein
VDGGLLVDVTITNITMRDVKNAQSSCGSVAARAERGGTRRAAHYQYLERGGLER